MHAARLRGGTAPQCLGDSRDVVQPERRRGRHGGCDVPRGLHGERGRRGQRARNLARGIDEQEPVVELAAEHRL
jgi:hypothetical protein